MVDFLCLIMTIFGIAIKETDTTTLFKTTAMIKKIDKKVCQTHSNYSWQTALPLFTTLLKASQG
jgi:hypothetical protein